VGVWGRELGPVVPPPSALAWAPWPGNTKPHAAPETAWLNNTLVAAKLL